MSISDINNPDVIKFLIENYEKNKRLRIKWNQINQDSLQKAATLQREEKGYYEVDVLKAAIIAELPIIASHGKVTAINKKLKSVGDAIYIKGIANLKKGHSIPETGLGDVKNDPRLGRPDIDLSFDPKMRPVDPKQKAVLYKSIPEFGREVYLKKRNKIDPNKKYYFRETSGCEYGWNLKDSFLKDNGPQFARVWRLTREVPSRTGPQPDPYYYRSSEIPGPAKCFFN